MNGINIKTVCHEKASGDLYKTLNSLFKVSTDTCCTNKAIKDILARNKVTGFSDRLIGSFFSSITERKLVKIGGKMHRGWMVEYVGTI